MSISRREMNVSRREIKKWAYSFLFYSLFFIVLRRTFWQFSVGFFFSFYLQPWGLSLYIQVSQAQLSGVQECRSDASLRSIDDSAACIVETIIYTPTLLPPTLLKNSSLLHSCYFSTCETWVIYRCISLLFCAIVPLSVLCQTGAINFSLSRTGGLV